MNTNQLSRKPLTEKVAEDLRRLVSSGRVESGAYLPAERELCERFEVSRVTVRRALARLVEEGLIAAVPYQGYRVVRGPRVAAARQTVAYVLGTAGEDEPWDRTHEQILTAFNRAQIARGEQVLGIGGRGRHPREIFDELKARSIWGVALDTSLPGYTDEALRAGLSVVLVDAYVDDPRADIVIQDNFNGARQVTRALLARGHRSVGWIGPTVVQAAEREAFLGPHDPKVAAGWSGFAHYRERFAGARAALFECNADFAPAHRIETAHSSDIDGAEAKVRALMQSPERPSALVCMWLEMAQGAARGIRAAGLQVGRDVDLACWCTEGEYREHLAPEFLGGEMPLAALWRPAEMAKLALQRLELRARDPEAPACRVDVKVRIARPAPAEEAVKGRIVW